MFRFFCSVIELLHSKGSPEAAIEIWATCRYPRSLPEAYASSRQAHRAVCGSQPLVHSTCAFFFKYKTIFRVIFGNQHLYRDSQAVSILANSVLPGRHFPCAIS